MTLVALTRALTCMPGRRSSSVAASALISATTWLSPTWMSTRAISPSTRTSRTTPGSRLRALVCMSAVLRVAGAAVQPDGDGEQQALGGVVEAASGDLLDAGATGEHRVAQQEEPPGGARGAPAVVREHPDGAQQVAGAAGRGIRQRTEGRPGLRLSVG